MLPGPEPPDDPSQLDPAVETLPSGSTLLRVHASFLEPNDFNPGFGRGGRFHFLEGRHGKQIPALYGAEGVEAALAETIFHDVPIRPLPHRHVGFRRLAQSVLSEVRTRKALRLVQLHHPGLGRLGLEPAEITATAPTHHPRTRRWAQALHDHPESIEGLVWTSRLHNTRRVYTLFGDRVLPSDLEVLSGPLPLWEGPSLQLVYELAEAAGIRVTLP